MKKIVKILLGVLVFSILPLLYVREQVNLFHLSYQIEAQTTKLANLSEEYRKLQYEVDQLKAPRLLEEKMKSLNLDLTLPQEIRVVRVPAAAKLQVPVPDKDAALDPLSFRPLSSRVMNFLGRWVEVAQAKTDN